MSDKVTMKVTVTFSYEADPTHYENVSPKRMAFTDKCNFENDLLHLNEAMESAEDFKIKVEPINE